MPSVDAIAFRVGDTRYLLPLTRVAEVSMRVAITELPQLAPPLLGMVNYRGQLVPVMSFAQRTGSEPASAHPPILSQHIVFVKTRQGTVGVQVDRAEDVVSFDPRAVADAPGSASLIVGLIEGEDGFILVSDPDAVFSVEERRNFEACLGRMMESESWTT